MRPIRRIQSGAAGFVKDISDIIAIEGWKDPCLIPDLSSDRSIFVFSDYSRGQGRYKTYSFFVIGRSGAEYFNGMRKFLRHDFCLGKRRMSFKGMNDGLKLRALPAFLDIASATRGFVLTFAVDLRIQCMFADQWLQISPEWSSFKKKVLEDMLRVAHFGALAVMVAFSSGQNVTWFTDSDSIVANEAHEQLFGKLAQACIRMFLPEETIGQVGFGLTSADDGSLEIEDFAAIPDLVAGALCETLDCLGNSGLQVTSKIALNKPKVTAKTDLIGEWMCKTKCPLKKFGVVLDKTGTGLWDFRPSFFTIRNADVNAPETCCGAESSASLVKRPIRFDVVDWQPRPTGNS